MQAPAYNRTKNFTDNNSDRTDHTALNAELDAAAASINALRTNAALIQKDDGTLANECVTPESLSPEALAAFQSPGPTGPAGPTGPTGPAGPQGVKGDIGASFTADASDLAAAKSVYDTQAKGFSFLAIDTGLLYFKLSATPADWSPGFSYGTGPTGPAGPTGATGAQGPQGPQGIQGIQGIQGVAGLDGLVTSVDLDTKSANLVGRSTVTARLVILAGELSIVLQTT